MHAVLYAPVLTLFSALNILLLSAAVLKTARGPGKLLGFFNCSYFLFSKIKTSNQGFLLFQVCKALNK